MNNEYSIESRSYSKYSVENQKKIRALIREVFLDGFTGALSDCQLDRYFRLIESSKTSSKFLVIYNHELLIGVALLGAKKSLLDSIAIGSVKDISDFITLTVNLLRNPKVFFISLKNMISHKKNNSLLASIENDSLYLSYIAVEKSFTRRGIGKALLDRSCAEAKVMGFKTLYCNLDNRSLGVPKFYKSCGWSIIGEGTRALALKSLM